MPLPEWPNQNRTRSSSTRSRFLARRPHALGVKARRGRGSGHLGSDYCLNRTAGSCLIGADAV
jgi:hypothetical protein